MKTKLAADGRRRSKWEVFCNPLVAKGVIAVARLIYELLRIFQRH